MYDLASIVFLELELNRYVFGNAQMYCPRIGECVHFNGSKLRQARIAERYTSAVQAHIASSAK